MTDAHRLLFLVTSGVVGLLVGSFLNVCVFRLPRHCLSVIRPLFSMCPRCRIQIAWYDNIPVASWLILGGKCRGCKGGIGFRYTAVELLTGALFLLLGWRLLYGGGDFTPLQIGARFAVTAAFLAALVVCTFVDIEFQILPDEITKGGTVVALAVSAALPVTHLGPLPGTAWDPHLKGLVASALGAATGSALIFLINVFGTILFRRRLKRLGETDAMGFGDVKFMAMIGGLLGWSGVLLTLLVAVAAGALFGIGKWVFKRRMGIVAFGPFLALGAVVVVFWTPEVMRAIRWYQGLFLPTG